MMAGGAASMIAQMREASAANLMDICYHCKQPGHWKVNCPLLVENGGTGIESTENPAADVDAGDDT